MRIEGTHVFSASREHVYQVFTDHQALAQATPGLQSLTPLGENRYEAVMKVGVAGITGTYKGTLEIRDPRPPEGYTLAIAGEGAPGFVRGTASFRFEEAGGQTTVRYEWDVQVGGLVAGVGQRVLGGVAKLLIGQFMGAMAKEIERRRGGAAG